MGPTMRALPAGSKLIYTEPGEAFSLYIMLSMIVGVVLASPFIMFQVWMFVAPGLYQNEKKLAIPFVVLTTLGFVGGAGNLIRAGGNLPGGYSPARQYRAASPK